ncbi:MAG: hypothetical protein G01um101429_786 [Parcubacteria group bacterium Gr01-1014_29]|nr:MAG: hypothetical protein G01um101429_786 [Parcubacteria group bacterium Gr01-1014_29]
MKSRDDIEKGIENLVQNLGGTWRSGGKFLADDDVDVFWDKIREISALRIVSAASFDKEIAYKIFSDYRQNKRRKGYDCACDIARAMFQACSAQTIAEVLKKPFDAHFKKTTHKSSFYVQGYYIRHAYVGDFSKAAADHLCSLDAHPEVPENFEEEVFHVLSKFGRKQNDDDLAAAVMNELEQTFKKKTG